LPQGAGTKATYEVRIGCAHDIAPSRATRRGSTL
jgi:hypothetical protein